MLGEIYKKAECEALNELQLQEIEKLNKIIFDLELVIKNDSAIINNQDSIVGIYSDYVLGLQDDLKKEENKVWRNRGIAAVFFVIMMIAIF